MNSDVEIKRYILALEEEIRSGESLAPVEETLSSIVSALPDIVYRLDAEGNIVFISDAVRSYGYEPAELIGCSLMDLVHPQDRKRAQYRVNDRRTRGRATKSFEVRFVTSDESTVAFEFNESTTAAASAPTLLVDAEGVYSSQDPTSGTFQYTQGVARDITGRKQVEESLKRARAELLERTVAHSNQIGAAYVKLEESLKRASSREEHYRSLVDNLPVGVSHTTIDGTVKYQNGYARAMLGYSEEELAEVRSEDLYVNVEDLAHLHRVLDEREVHSFECEMRRKGGRTIWVRGTTRVVRNEAERAVEYHSFVEDVTDRRMMEEEYGRLEEQLRQAQKMEAVGQITAGIAHNFNNLLQGITGNLQLALLDAPQEIRQLLEDADSVTERAAEMVQQLMIFSRQGIQPTNKTMDIWPVIEGTLDMCRRTFDKKIALVSPKPEFDARVSGDEGLLQQVLLNLCINARDALDAGSSGAIHITVQMSSVTEEEAAIHAGARPGAYVRIAVADNGVGIDEVTKRRIFDPFFTTKGIGKGTGLGLATVYGIVSEHKGWVECESEVGVGSTFSVMLPAIAREAEEASVDESLPTESSAASEITILVVDDEDVVRTSTVKLLERTGYQVCEAVDGRQAMEIFRRDAAEIHVVLLDLNMPGKSGHEVLVELREVNPQIKVIILTGYAAHEDEVEGASALLQKPFSVDELRQKLSDVLDNG